MTMIKRRGEEEGEGKKPANNPIYSISLKKARRLKETNGRSLIFEMSPEEAERRKVKHL